MRTYVNPETNIFEMPTTGVSVMRNQQMMGLRDMPRNKKVAASVVALGGALTVGDIVSQRIEYGKLPDWGDIGTATKVGFALALVAAIYGAVT